MCVTNIKKGDKRNTVIEKGCGSTGFCDQGYPDTSGDDPLANACHANTSIATHCIYCCAEDLCNYDPEADTPIYYGELLLRKLI